MGIDCVMLKLFQKDKLLIQTSYFRYLFTIVTFFLVQSLSVGYVRIMLMVELFEK